MGGLAPSRSQNETDTTPLSSLPPQCHRRSISQRLSGPGLHALHVFIAALCEHLRVLPDRAVHQGAQARHDVLTHLLGAHGTAAHKTIELGDFVVGHAFRFDEHHGAPSGRGLRWLLAEEVGSPHE